MLVRNHGWKGRSDYVWFGFYAHKFSIKRWIWKYPGNIECWVSRRALSTMNFQYMIWPLKCKRNRGATAQREIDCRFFLLCENFSLCNVILQPIPATWTEKLLTPKWTLLYPLFSRCFCISLVLAFRFYQHSEAELEWKRLQEIHQEHQRAPVATNNTKWFYNLRRYIYIYIF